MLSTTRIPLTLAAALLALTACAPAAMPGGHASHDGHNHEATNPTRGTETPDRSPRIVIATETGVAVLDSGLKPLSTFQTKQRPTLTVAHDDRHVIATQTSAGVVSVVDAGSWKLGHGDHFHFFTASPSLAKESLNGGKPVHVVPNAQARVTTVFFDELGTGFVLDDQALEGGEFDHLAKITTKGPQHGVVVPLPKSTWLVSQPGAKAGALPDTIEQRDSAGKVVATHNCKQMHGEVVVGSTAAFGCSDSVLILNSGKETVVPAPDQSGERVGGLNATKNGSAFVGDWGSTSLVFINGNAAKVVELGVEYGNRTVLPDGRVAVLGTDGALRLFDMTGKELQKLQVTKAWKVPQGHGGVAPAITSGTQEAAPMVWVSEPGSNQVHAVDLFSNKVTSVTVDGAPSSIAVTNAS